MSDHQFLAENRVQLACQSFGRLVVLGWVWLFLWVFTASVYAQGMGDDTEVSTSYVAQVGVDAWHLSPKTPEKLLNLPTSTQWPYKSVSPWLTFDGQMTVSRQALMNLKVRADQSMGTHVDEMSLDWSVSPRLGFKAGVLSYKTSWCRSYDVDSAWVRENDPFCTVKSTNDASGGAPGLQVYTNVPVGSYRVQALAGLYRPLFLNYNTTEFSNSNYAISNIERNNKKGVSLSVQNIETATELRVGLLQADQVNLNAGSAASSMHVRIQQNYDMVFLGGAFYVAPQVQVRVQALWHHRVANEWTVWGVGWPNYYGGDEVVRRSDVVEVNYQHSSKDMFGFAMSHYTFNTSVVVTKYPFPGYVTKPNYFLYHNKSMSASWRHDWGQGIYTAVQWSDSKFDLYRSDQLPSPNREAGGQALGVRLGYQF